MRYGKVSINRFASHYWRESNWGTVPSYSRRELMVYQESVLDLNAHRDAGGSLSSYIGAYPEHPKKRIPFKAASRAVYGIHLRMGNIGVLDFFERMDSKKHREWLDFDQRHVVEKKSDCAPRILSIDEMDELMDRGKSVFPPIAMPGGFDPWGKTLSVAHTVKNGCMSAGIPHFTKKWRSEKGMLTGWEPVRWLMGVLSSSWWRNRVGVGGAYLYRGDLDNIIRHAYRKRGGASSDVHGSVDNFRIARHPILEVKCALERWQRTNASSFRSSYESVEKMLKEKYWGIPWYDGHSSILTMSICLCTERQKLHIGDEGLSNSPYDVTRDYTYPSNVVKYSIADNALMSIGVDELRLRSFGRRFWTKEQWEAVFGSGKVYRKRRDTPYAEGRNYAKAKLSV